MRILRELLEKNLAKILLLGTSRGRKIYFRAKKLSVKYVYPSCPWLHDAIFVRMKAKIRRRYLNILRGYALSRIESSELYRLNDQEQQLQKVSIIVPNYCHAKFLEQRLESIYSQTYKNYEVILLDDASRDGSIDILDSYYNKYPEITIRLYNSNNSGSVFKQWRRGLEIASGELVWIAESDDYCSENFLEETIAAFSNQAVMLSYARTVFVSGDKPGEIWTIEEYLNELDAGLWKKPFLLSAHQLVNKAWSKKNIVPNVSSAVFRHPGRLKLLEDADWQEMRICGDWAFYLHVACGGLVAYTTYATNFYRIHDNNTSTSTYSQDVYYEEHERIARALVSLYRLEEGALEQQRAILEAHWKLHRAGLPKEEFERCYDLARVLPLAASRKPNLMMALLAFVAGGGETFPIELANLLKSKGYPVCLFNCRYDNSEPGVRAMLGANIPVLELDNINKLPVVVEDMGIEVVHSHHAWVDATVCALLEENDEVKHVITTHGMYELISTSELKELLPLLNRRVSKIVYTADKNLAAFMSSGIDRSRFVKIGNALGNSTIHPVGRETLGIAATAFAVCLVSRAVPDKGWQEAIEAVRLARQHSDRDIHLVLIGEGPEYSRIKVAPPDHYVHLLGFKSNIRDYFAMADLGLLPSRFVGESFPLVLIDCLRAGRPVLASNVGEISAMLQAEHGLAGAVFNLVNGAIPVEELARLIITYATNQDIYMKALNNAVIAVRKFDPEIMVGKYCEVYAEITRADSAETGLP